MALPTKPTQSDNGQPETYKMFDTEPDTPEGTSPGVNGQPETYRVFDTDAPAAPNSNPVKAKYDDFYHSVLIGVPVESIRPALESGATIGLDAQARQITEQNQQSLVRSFVSSPEMEDAVKVLQDEILATEHVSPFITPATVALLTSPDPEMQTFSVQRVSRVMKAQSMIQDRLSDASEEGFLTNFDFVDYAFSSAQNLFLVDKQRESADRAAELMYDLRVSDEDFEVEFSKVLQDMGNQGFFEDNNRFYLEEFLELFAAGSNSSVAKWQKAWAVFDTATFGLGAAPTALKVGKGVVKGAATVASGGSLTGVIKTGASTALAIATNPVRLVGSKTNNPNLTKGMLDEARGIDDPFNPSMLHSQVTTSLVTPELLRGERLAHVSNANAWQYANESKVLDSMLEAAGRAGSAIDDSRLAIFQSRLQGDAKIAAAQSGDMSYIDAHLYPDELGNLYFSEIRGTNDGMSFVGPNGQIAAQNLADNIGGEVVEWQNPGHFVVVQTKNIPTSIGDLSKEDLMLYSVTNPGELGEGFVPRWLGSPATQTTDANRAALLTAEGAQERWTTISEGYVRDSAKLVSRKEYAEVEEMFIMLRDGHFADQRKAFNEAEFRVEFDVRHLKPPTEAQVALYRRQQDLLDAESFFVADTYFKRHVNEGVQVLDNQYRVVPKRSSDLPEGAIVYDSTGNTYKASDLPKNQTVYENFDPDNQLIFGGRPSYVIANDLKTRRLYHADLLARNSGGPRLYRNGEHKIYIKQDRNVVMDDGTVKKAAPRTVMATKTEVEGSKAVKFINSIIDELGVALKSTKFTNADVATLRGNSKLDNFIATNSEWNPSINSVHALLKWADESGANLSSKFSAVGHGKEILGNDVVGGFAGMPLEMAMDARAFNPLSRRNSVLLGYGGKQSRVFSPMKAMEITRSELVANQSYRAYTARAINGLMKSALRNKVLENGKDLVNMTLRQKLINAKIDTTTSVGRKLALEQTKIKFRLDRKGLGDAQWSALMDKASDFLYGKGFTKLSNATADMSSVNPITAMRGWVFNAKLGMFNPAQLYVQASQIINIFPVGGVSGLKGGALYGPVRFALWNNNPEVIKAIGARVGPVVGISADEFVDMVSMFKDHGRSMVGVSLAELGTDAATASSILGETYKAVTKAGRVFFNEGELVARTTAWNAAYIDYLKRFPDKSPRSQHGVRWIMNRQDTLTQSMSGASRLELDKLPMTQFLSYPFRINEALFAGSFGGKAVLTKAEKVRLAAAHTVMFGASGWAVSGTAMDWYNYRYGIDLDEGAYRAVRKGAMDYLLSEISGVDTSLSSRLGSGDNMFMLMKDLSENNLAETLSGPSGEVTWETLKVLKSAAGYLAKGVTTGDFDDLGTSLGRFARVFSTGNQSYNAYMALNAGQYLTKDNALIDDKLTDMEAIFIGLGVPLEDHEEAFKFSTFSRFEKLLLGTTVKQVQREWNNANAQLARGEHGEALETMKGIALLYHSLPLNDSFIVRDSVRKTGGTITDENMLRAFQQEQARNLNKEEK